MKEGIMGQLQIEHFIDIIVFLVLTDELPHAIQAR
jgi:hypothetical protein